MYFYPMYFMASKQSLRKYSGATVSTRWVHGGPFKPSEFLQGFLKGIKIRVTMCFKVFVWVLGAFLI